MNRKGRPPKESPEYHRGFGDGRIHKGRWRHCAICKRAYGQEWRKKYYGQKAEGIALR